MDRFFIRYTKKYFIDSGGGRMRHRKIALSLLFVLLSTVMLAGCGSEEAKSNYDSQVSASSCIE